MAARAWWLDERCFAVEKIGEEPHALRAYDLARILIDECIYAVTQDSSFRHLHVLELFAPHGLHRKPPQRCYEAYVFTNRHVFLPKRFRAISWSSETIPVPKSAMPLMGVATDGLDGADPFRVYLRMTPGEPPLIRRRRSSAGCSRRWQRPRPARPPGRRICRASAPRRP